MGLFGGGNSTSTNQNTTNNYDQRQVITTTATSNSLSNSGNTITNLTDGGAIAGMIDVAKAAIAGSTAATLNGYDYADHIFSAAVKSNADAFDAAASVTRDSMSKAQTAFQKANDSVATAYGTAAAHELQAYTAAQSAAQLSQAATAAAYADAKGTTAAQKQIIIGVLVVAGVMALGMMQRKG